MASLSTALAGGLAAVVLVAPPDFPTPPGAKNLLLIAVDDLRPMMHEAYNFSRVIDDTCTCSNVHTFSFQPGLHSESAHGRRVL